jgi:anti-anti-sigma factor
MAPVQSLSVTFARRGLIDFARRDAAHTVVWLRGEHDISTVGALSETLARAIARDADVVVDLSEVDFMGAATVGVIIRAGELLGLRSRSLAVRSPSRCARRILDLCGRAGLLDPRSVDTGHLTGTDAAQSTRVAAPAPDRVDQGAEASASTRGSAVDPVRAGRVTAVRVSSVGADADHRADARTTKVTGRGGP